jgi:hypothetical protein
MTASGRGLLSDKELAKLKIREVGPDGRLKRSGFWWGEPQRWVAKFGGSLAALCICAMLAGCYQQSKGPSSDANHLLWGGGAVLAFVIFGLGRFEKMRRQVEFCDDGQILFTFTRRNRFARKPKLDALAKSHDSIVRIEVAAGSFNTYAILMYFSDGQEMPLSINLSLKNARLITVGLTEALADMRKSTGKKPVMEILID